MLNFTVKSFSVSFILYFLIIMAVTVPSNADSNTEMKKVNELLFRYKNGYEQNDYSLISSCLYPPMSDYIRSMGELLNAKKGLLETLINKWGKGWVEEKKLGVLAMDPFASIIEINYTNIRIEGNKAYADSEKTTTAGKSLGNQILAKSDGKWYISQQSGKVGYSENEIQIMKEMIKYTLDHEILINTFKSQIENGFLTQDDFINNLFQSESQYVNTLNSLKKRYRDRTPHH